MKHHNTSTTGKEKCILAHSSWSQFIKTANSQELELEGTGGSWRELLLASFLADIYMCNMCACTHIQRCVGPGNWRLEVDTGYLLS